MGSDLYMNPPRPPSHRATWDGDEIVVERIYEDRIYTQSKLGWHEIWRGTLEEAEKVKNLLPVAIPDKPGSRADIAKQNKMILGNAHALAEQAARRSLNIASEAGLQDLTAMVTHMTLAYEHELIERVLGDKKSGKGNTANT